MVTRRKASTPGARRPPPAVGRVGSAGHAVDVVTTPPRPAAALDVAEPTNLTTWTEQPDPNMHRLVRALNAFPGLLTIGRCGGHEHPSPAQWPAGSWYVKFEVARTDDGWFAPEFLVWFVNNDYRRAGHRVTLFPTAAPPYLNIPGQCLRWAFEGYDGEDPDQLAKWIAAVHEDSYVSPREAARASKENAPAGAPDCR